MSGFLSRTKSSPVAAACAGLLISACTVGPDYVRPQVPPDATYVAGEVPTQTVSVATEGGEAQRFEFGRELPNGWWQWFGSRELTQLVERAFNGNPSLAAARARLRGAEATLRARRGLRSPELGIVGSGSYGTSPQGGGGGFSNENTQSDDQWDSAGSIASDRAYAVYTANATVTYDLDLAGRNRRLVEAAEADAQGQHHELQAAYLAVAGNIVSTALQAATLRAQIEAREQLLSGQNQRIEFIRLRVEEGASARADLLAALAEVSSLRASVPALRSQLAAAEHRLAELLGVPPNRASLPVISLAGVKLPQLAPVSLPSQLVRTRPDILASESLLRAASAQIGVATADLYPNVTLDASYGVIGIKSELETVFDIGADLFAPLFDGGRRRAQRDVAVAGYQEALAGYRERVLAAFVEVANALRALENDAVALAEQRVALEAAQESLELAQFREREGASSAIDVLVVQQRYQDTRFAYIDTLSQRFQDTAALFAALGPAPIDATALRAIEADESLDATREALESGAAPQSIAPL
jgi:NodT family efflux transporter outer membrane factor (OMF) lipoprotein